MTPPSSGTTSSATTSQPAASASRASAGPDTSSFSWRETVVETVRTAVRMRPRRYCPFLVPDATKA
jgi:hypothetical protein